MSEMLARLDRTLVAMDRSSNTRLSYMGHCHKFFWWLVRRHGRSIRPEHVGADEIKDYLADMAAAHRPAATRRGAFYAIKFLFDHVLRIKLEGLDALRPFAKQRVPDVFSVAEVAAILQQMQGIDWLLAAIAYGSGLRVGALVALRVKDLQLHDPCMIVVRRGKGDKDRVTPLPRCLVEPLKEHQRWLYGWYEDDRRRGRTCVLPQCLASSRKFWRGAEAFEWWPVFPSRHLCDRGRKRGHIHPDTFARALKKAASRAGVHRRVHPHMLRHSHVTHSLDNGELLHRVSRWVGHNKLETTARYIHFGEGVRPSHNPLDELAQREAASALRGDRRGLRVRRA